MLARCYIEKRGELLHGHSAGQARGGQHILRTPFPRHRQAHVRKRQGITPDR